MMIGPERYAAEWAAVCATRRAGELLLRDPAASPAGLLGPMRGKGYCLDPLLTERTEPMWFDEKAAAEDGDVVLAELHPSVIDLIFEQRVGDARFLAEYGPRRAELGRVIKVLRYIEGVPFLLTNDSATPLNRWRQLGRVLEASRILGVLRYIGPAINLLDARAPSFLPGNTSARLTEDLNPEAVTTDWLFTDDTGVGYSNFS